jgi:hypothetical protein
MSRFATVLVLCLAASGCGGPQPTDPTGVNDQSENALKRKHKCQSNSDCSEIEYCDTEAAASCDSTGVCTARGINLLCSNLWIGVCGCDGHTYGNDCLMHKAGVSKAHDGACAPPCQSNDDCSELEYCAFPVGQCGGDGACTSRGINLFCTTLYQPVCGCDGTTYTNTCYANKAGQSLVATGACD